MDKKAISAAAIIIAAIFWGFIGVFSRELEVAGFTSIQVTEARCIVTALGLLIIILIYNRKLLSIVLKDLIFFLAAALVFIAYNVLYFQEIAIDCPLSMVSVMLYTAPFFVLILSVIIFKEKLTAQKIAALIIAFIGCALAVGLIGGENGSLNMAGFWMGLGSGLTYALYTIINKFMLEKYDPLTVTFYCFTVSAILLIPFSDLIGMFDIAFNVEGAWMWMVGLGLFITLLPYFLYSYGLKGLDAGYVSVLAFIEPIVATIAGLLMYNQEPTALKIVGIVLVLVGVVLLNINIKKKDGKRIEESS